MRTETEHTIYLKDYAPTPYFIDRVELEVEIAPEKSVIHALLHVVPREGTEPGTPLVLDGDELLLNSVAIDGAPLGLLAYEVTPSSLTINEPPLRRFVLETTVTIEPEKNTRLMGFYRSNGTWCTQCEPEGFRRITYYLDRPDNLATFNVTMIADKALAPVLLANGNPAGSGELENGKHFAVWEDPHPKPSYLFAMVAGDLGAIHDSFTTTSGKEVALAIYCEHGKEDRCLYAMDALKRSMAWDERRFGLEYDLDVFNIVAVSDFNFGAMENKGLNIFNDRLVFAIPETATDADYDNVERVIAHEYFHNWTGDRVTCRDWFQLCLKEGLTVYRDQEFSSDERSRPVKRIEDVRLLRSAQFVEDGGPLAHPPRPDHYREINNFYTTTVYEKGAEVVRMLATMLGREGFRKGMDLYFERHDGQAATIEDFVAAFADSAGVNLDQFIHWYLQAGTPQVAISDEYDAASQTYKLKLTQKTDPTPGQPDKRAMVIPVRFGLIGPNGSPMSWSKVSGGKVEGDLIIFETDAMELTFEGIANRPVPSLLREFSAPVKLTTSLSAEGQLFLARHDSDPFNRWQALQTVATGILLDAVRAGGKLTDASRVEALADALRETIEGGSGDDAFKALTLSMPTEDNIAQAIGQNVDPLAIHEARGALRKAIAQRLQDRLVLTYNALADDSPFSTAQAATQRRALRNACLTQLVAGGTDEAFALAEAHYRGATNMTDRMAALSALVHANAPMAQALLGDFRTLYTADPLVLDKWLSLSAQVPDAGTLDRIKAILADPTFPKNNPNRLRSLVGSFANANPVQFAQPDGSGFRFVTEFVADVDKRNPQVAARVLTAFRIWRNYEPQRRAAAESALRSLEESGTLSRNTADILGRTLAG
ncbi:aminopeptidase N [Paradevosia shaoguanensis]|uniref:aminopeptidase N n=1 Tax=Paradevosia shaoguanensis TaxID=1335043 RepID=UPI003C736F45